MGDSIVTDGSEYEIRQMGDSRYVLGESPLWDPRTKSLYWVDVVGQTVWNHRPGTDDYSSWKLPDMVSSLALKKDGDAVVTLTDGFYDFSFDTSECTRIDAPIETDLPTRFNDGKVDRAGRHFVAGTMDNDIATPLGSLYSLSQDRTVTQLDTRIVCSNGPCWSLDGKTLYFTDTMRNAIFAYDYDADGGTVGPRRVFADMRAIGLKGSPDGCTVDSDGFLWSVQCLAGMVARIAPDGTLDRTIELPVKYVTSVTFGGENLDTLYVTSLNMPLVGKDPEEPNAGGLFAVYGLGFTGVPEPQYAG
jgi:sugar lactone lactonase YvrE